MVKGALFRVGPVLGSLPVSLCRDLVITSVHVAASVSVHVCDQEDSKISNVLGLLHVTGMVYCNWLGYQE